MVARRKPRADPGHPSVDVVFVAAFAGCELLPIHVEHRRETLTLSLSTVPLIVGLYTLAPTQLIVARVLGSIIAMAIRRLPRFKAAVNVAGFWMECVVATTVFAALHPHGYGPSTWLAAFVAALAADISQSVVLADRHHDLPRSSRARAVALAAAGDCGGRRRHLRGVGGGHAPGRRAGRRPALQRDRGDGAALVPRALRPA